MRICRVEGETVIVLFDGLWSNLTLGEIFVKLKKAIGKQRIRVLFDDEISYVFSLVVPKEVVDEREWIFSHILERVPEKITEKNWDFRYIKNVPEGREVLIFAPNESIWSALEKEAQQNEYTIEAIEPVVLAGKRHPNPIIGLARKEDLRGDDETILNISTSRESYIDVSTSEARGKRHVSRLFIIFLCVLVGVLSLLFGVYIVINRARFFPINVSVVQPQESTNSIETSPSPTVTQMPIDLSIYTLRILNGSGVSGAAKYVADILVSEGFTQIETGNADADDYIHIVVQQKESIPSGVFATIERALNGEYILKQGDLLTDKSQYDVLIIVGK